MISVLYVDDEEVLLTLCKLFLERSGDFSVDVCISAVEALDRLKNQTYDAIISDYQMPEMDGIEFLILVRSIFGDIPFILFTGRGREEVVVKAIDNGVDFYLQKGGDPKSQFAELAHKLKKSVERNLAVRALAKNEERMRLALEGANEGLWDINIASGESYMSPRGCEMLGYAPEDMKRYAGKNWRDLIHPDDLQHTLAALQEYYEGKSEFFHIQQRLQMKNGGWKWMLSRGKVVERDAGGNPVRVVGTHTDISEQKKAEAALTLAKKDWETIFRATANPTFILGSDHSIIDANEAALTLTGKSLDEIKGVKCWNVFHSPDATTYPHSCPLEKMRKSGVVETSIMEISALNRMFITSCTPIFDDTGALLKAIHIATDITEIKELENDLTENRDYLSQIFSSVKEGIVIIDAHTHEILDINPAAIQMIGADREDIINHICHKFICPADIDNCPFTDLHQTVDNSERILLTADGRKIPIIKHVVPFTFRGRACLLETFIDNSERKAAEEQLREAFEQIAGAEEELRSQLKELTDLKDALFASEAKYRTMVETTPDIIWDIEPDGTLSYVSPQSFAILGYTPEELEGTSVLSLVASYAQEEIAAVFRSAGVKDTGIISLDVPVLHRNGTIRMINSRSFPLKDSSGTLLGFRGIARDVTDWIATNDALRLSEERFNQVADNAGEWIWEIDETGRYQYCSQAVSRILGYTPDELVGTYYFWDLFTPDVRDELHAVAMKAFTLQVPFRHFVNPNLHKSGKLVMLETSGSPYYDAKGVFLGYRGTDTDVTERKNAETTLRRINRHLSLLSSVTRYDMLNSITTILASLKSIEEQTVQFDMKEDIEQLKSAIMTLQSQVTYTQVYQDIGAFDPQWQDLQNVFSSLVIPDSVTFTWDKENILVFADPMLDKVFMILLENSLTHGKYVSGISLGIRKTESGLLFTWEDNGVGVEEGEKEQIFEKGFGKNTGLGLFLAREILALTGISIRETGIEGRGAKFDILVPAEFYRIKPEKWGTAIWSDQREV